MASSRELLRIASTFVLISSFPPFVDAAEPPADLCSLLPAAAVSKTLGYSVSDPKKSVAERPFANTNPGTDCHYESSHRNLLLRVYVDPSPSASADLFARLKAFFGQGSKDASGIGDEAYFDKSHGLHVRKGKVRFFLSGPDDEIKLGAMATSVAAQL